MCGITGIFSLSGKPIREGNTRIQRMTRMLKHRGPDGEGVYVSPDGICALGNTRLAVVDPYTPVSQPMTTKNDSLILSFNGEIYNFHELKNGLEQKGVSFRTHTDTEVLLEGLHHYGESFLDKLQGMWAFAFYDKVARQLLLSRDLMGERPLFYHRNENQELVFASEIAPILADSPTSFDIDFNGFLSAFKYFSPPLGKTMVRGVERLRAGHNLKLQIQKEVVEVRYKKIHLDKWLDFFSRRPSLEETSGIFEGILYKVCQTLLPQDASFMAGLSGGLDSSLICLYLSAFGKRRIRTLFGQNSEEFRKQHNVENWGHVVSQKVSNHIRSEHHYCFLDNEKSGEFLRYFSENAFDGLFESSTAAFGRLAHYVREQHGKVLIMGDGCDELLGYPKDRFQYFQSLKGEKNGEGNRFCFSPINEYMSAGKLEGWLEDGWQMPNNQEYGVIDPVYQDYAKRLDFSQLCALSYVSSSLPDMFNLRSDKANMLSSVEVRLPYLSPQVVEFLIAMPASFRFGTGETTKYILRHLIQNYLGAEIAHRPKQGFCPPVWLSPQIYPNMDYEEVLYESPIFTAFPFRKGFKKFILNWENRDLLWSFYVLAKVHEKLRAGNFE